MAPSSMGEGVGRSSCIVVRGVSKVFSGGVRALDGVSMVVEEGEIHAVLGPNGAGKTTLMRVLTTQIKPSSGDAWVLGRHVVKEAARVREVIGYVPQEFSVWTDLTGYENAMIYAKLYGVPPSERRRVVEDMLEFMGLGEAKHRLVKTYSGGMIRRLELGIALMTKPRVLFLDEPTIGLDPRARELVWSRILEYAGEGGVTVVFNTHYMDEAERFAGKVTVMNRGRVIAEGAPRELVEKAGGGATVKIEFDGELEKALGALSGVRGVEVVSAGNPVVLRVEDLEVQVAGVFRALLGNGVNVKKVSLQPPSLEDVFLRLTGMTFEEAERSSLREVAATRKAIGRGG
ncbi:ABC transporter related [Thermofilum pendens Hrk 5]|uniref:ABC transporter related n=2 Tax=Thermofilum pendens TaxID=2269 RepID=A1S0H5_THEPD|nr:ABC transporter related [Thermofilum pendens Hrk 5]